MSTTQNKDSRSELEEEKNGFIHVRHLYSSMVMAGVINNVC